jgi:hypothetical protein
LRLLLLTLLLLLLTLLLLLLTLLLLLLLLLGGPLLLLCQPHIHLLQLRVPAHNHAQFIIKLGLHHRDGRRGPQRGVCCACGCRGVCVARELNAAAHQRQQVVPQQGAAEGVGLQQPRLCGHELLSGLHRGGTHNFAEKLCKEHWFRWMSSWMQCKSGAVHVPLSTLSQELASRLHEGGGGKTGHTTFRTLAGWWAAGCSASWMRYRVSAVHITYQPR